MPESGSPIANWQSVEIEGMPQFDRSMERVYAWFENEIIDRPPIEFRAPDPMRAAAIERLSSLSAQTIKDWWFDVEAQVGLFVDAIAGRRFYGESFPVFFSNLGPDVYAAFFGAELHFTTTTSWSDPIVHTWDDIEKLAFDRNNTYFKKLEELIQLALERCRGKALVGYPDLHPGLDCVAAWRDPQQLCLDMIEAPEKVQQIADLAIADFETIFNHFDSLLKNAGQLSVTWLHIPSYGRLHIPSRDFAALISPQFFERFGLPLLQREVKGKTHNIFHIDGRGVLKNIDEMLAIPDIHALQWVQGAGEDSRLCPGLALSRNCRRGMFPWS